MMSKAAVKQAGKIKRGFDWAKIDKLYLTWREENPDVSIADFARQYDLKVNTCQKRFAKFKNAPAEPAESLQKAVTRDYDTTKRRVTGARGWADMQTVDDICDAYGLPDAVRSILYAQSNEITALIEAVEAQRVALRLAMVSPPVASADNGEDTKPRTDPGKELYALELTATARITTLERSLVGTARDLIEVQKLQADLNESREKRDYERRKRQAISSAEKVRRESGQTYTEMLDALREQGFPDCADSVLLVLVRAETEEEENDDGGESYCDVDDEELLRIKEQQNARLMGEQLEAEVKAELIAELTGIRPDGVITDEMDFGDAIQDDDDGEWDDVQSGSVEIISQSNR